MLCQVLAVFGRVSQPSIPSVRIGSISLRRTGKDGSVQQENEEDAE